MGAVSDYESKDRTIVMGVRLQHRSNDQIIIQNSHGSPESNTQNEKQESTNNASPSPYLSTNLESKLKNNSVDDDPIEMEIDPL